MKWPRRFWLALLVVFGVRTLYAGLVHGPLLLTPLVYVRFPTTMNLTMNLPALLGVEALISFLFTGAYGAYFRDRHPRWSNAAGFGAVLGLFIYLPQNLLNLILLQSVRLPLVLAWIGAGSLSGIISAFALRAIWKPR